MNRKKISQLEKPVMRKYPPVIVKCKQCGISFPTTKGSHAAKFCDQECRDKDFFQNLELQETKKFKAARLAREMDKQTKRKEGHNGRATKSSRHQDW